MLGQETLRDYLLNALQAANASDRIDLSRKAVDYAIRKKDTELLIMTALEHSIGSRVSKAATTLEDFTLNDIPESVTERQFVDLVKSFYLAQGYEDQGLDAAGMHKLHKTGRTLHANISFAHDHCFITINNYNLRELPPKA